MMEAKKNTDDPTTGATSSESPKEKRIISWDEYFMGIAFLSAKRSKDPSRQVGACIINAEKRIVATGYNGFIELPPGTDNDVAFKWGKLDKHPYVCHAEMNAVVNRHGTSLTGCTVYVTLFPCNECAKLLIQSGIKEVIYYADDKAKKKEFQASRKMMELAHVNLTEYKDLKENPDREINLKFDDFAKLCQSPNTDERQAHE